MILKIFIANNIRAFMLKSNLKIMYSYKKIHANAYLRGKINKTTLIMKFISFFQLFYQFCMNKTFYLKFSVNILVAIVAQTQHDS